METDSFETELRQALARRAAQVPGEAVERLEHMRYRPRNPGQTRMAIAGLTGVAAVAAVAGIAIAQPASHQTDPQASTPASPKTSVPAQIQLAAWTVTKQAGGTVTITIKQMSDPAAENLAGLQAELRAGGIPASVGNTANPACTPYPASELHGANALQLPGIHDYGKPVVVHVTIFVLHSWALPAGAGVQIIVPTAGHLIARLVQASPQCTGS
jgi:hypothetical protein